MSAEPTAPRVVYFEMNTERFRAVDGAVPVIECCHSDALSQDSWRVIRDRDFDSNELFSAVMSARADP